MLVIQPAVIVSQQPDLTFCGVLLSHTVTVINGTVIITSVLHSHSSSANGSMPQILSVVTMQPARPVALTCALLLVTCMSTSTCSIRSCLFILLTKCLPSLRLCCSDLSENKLVVIPPCIGGLVTLNRLDLHSNNIEVLPEEIGNLKKVSQKHGHVKVHLCSLLIKYVRS